MPRRKQRVRVVYAGSRGQGRHRNDPPAPSNFFCRRFRKIKEMCRSIPSPTPPRHRCRGGERVRHGGRIVAQMPGVAFTWRPVCGFRGLWIQALPRVTPPPSTPDSVTGGGKRSSMPPPSFPPNLRISHALPSRGRPPTPTHHTGRGPRREFGLSKTSVDRKLLHTYV